jgi:hypothetical protein
MDYIYFYTIDENVFGTDGIINLEDIEKTNLYISSYTKLDNAIKSSLLNIGDSKIDNVNYYMAQGNAIRLKPDYSRFKEKDLNKHFRYSKNIKNIILLTDDDIIKLSKFQCQEIDNCGLYIYIENKKRNIKFEVCFKNGYLHSLTDYKYHYNDIQPPTDENEDIGLVIVVLEMTLIFGLILFNPQLVNSIVSFLNSID